MHKGILLLGVTACLTAAFTFTASASMTGSPDQCNGISIQIDGKSVTSDIPAYVDLESARTLASVRVISEGLGAHVEWDSQHRAVLINTPSFPSDIKPSDSIAVFVYGKLLTGDAPAVLKQDRVFVPVRAIAEALQANVAWNQDSQAVRITSQAAIDEYNQEEVQVQSAFKGVGLTPHIASDGTKEFTLTAEPHAWEPIQGVVANAWTFNGQAPGPVIRVTEGDHVRITLINKLPEPTTIHWHGLHLPNEMDGVPDITQKPVQPGDAFTYEFIASHAGTFMYHSHFDDLKQVGSGLYGAFIIDPKNPSSETKYDHEYTMLLSGFHVNTKMEDSEDYFTIDGRSYPDTQPIAVKKGETVRIRLINIDPTEYHTMHLHGMDFQVIAKDGHPSTNPQKMNTLMIGPGETYDIAFQADAVGTWMFHCHILDHTMNGNSMDMGEMGGLITVVKVQE